MKKFILGLCCGLIIACSSVAFASGSIQALLFPASFEMNGSPIALNDEYKVLNVDGHAYVPIRFVAENLGATIDYDTELQKIYVKNRNLDLKDPDYKGISVGNLILTKSGNHTKVTGQLKMEGVGNSKNMIAANLSFFNDKSEKIGGIDLTGNDFGVDSQTFVSEGLGDFRTYSAVNLHIGAVNNHIVQDVPTIIYKNMKHNFTLNLPQTWEGKYEVVNRITEAGTEYLNFIDKANNGYGGVVFTISIWMKDDWIENGPSVREVGQIYKIGEKDDKVFTLSPPGDVEYDPNDEKLTMEYASMSDHINNIKTTFKLIN
ncbi:stalk domain-containing protein [Paenibacillus sp. N3.4]|uniref:stalk domain-containing protein n=1 Tax=Paenibacillus sp. N3.4 TaxID=2603222 RepID=UPI0011CA432C|nr:stalk domain-containing protein [Paenibacillus sp. N3.4]TXK71913.1 copper amine oxidase N-terminal domain-containing protein [Paenibacillus sp. N3.4]